MKNFALLMMLIISIPSCTSDYDTGILEDFSKDERPLKIYTKVLTTRSTHFMQEFVGGSVIGLHVISEKTGNPYKMNIAYKNVRAEAYMKDNELFWNQTPEIRLNSETAILYAYYPFQEQAHFDPENIPVRISPDATLSQDYMYGTIPSGQKSVNRISPIALLNMKHALALLGFQIHLKEGISRSYLLNAIQIGNKAGGTALCSRGRMNIKTGQIGGCTGTNASTRLTFNTPHVLNASHTEVHQLMVIPTSRISKEGDVEVLFNIDNKTFKFNMPASTEWKKGKRYVYSLIFDGKSLHLDKTDSSEWLPIKYINN